MPPLAADRVRISYHPVTFGNRRCVFRASGCRVPNLVGRVFKCCGGDAGVSRHPHPCQPGRADWAIPGLVSRRARVRRAGRYRRALPLGMYPGPDDGAKEPQLRDAPCRARISWCAVDRRGWTAGRAAGNIRTCPCILSRSDTRMDHAPWRAELPGAAATREGSRQNLSNLSMKTAEVRNQERLNFD